MPGSGIGNLIIALNGLAIGGAIASGYAEDVKSRSRGFRRWPRQKLRRYWRKHRRRW